MAPYLFALLISALPAGALQAFQHGAGITSMDVGTEHGIIEASSAACVDQNPSACLGKQYRTNGENCEKDGYTGHYWRTRCVKTCGYCNDPRYVTQAATEAKPSARAAVVAKIPWAAYAEQSHGACPSVESSTCEEIADSLGLDFSTLKNKLNPPGCSINYGTIPNKMYYNSAKPWLSKACSSTKACVCQETTEHTIQQASTMHYLDAYTDRGNDYSAATRKPQGDDSQKWVLTRIGMNEYHIQQKINMLYLDAWEDNWWGRDYSVAMRAAQGDDSQRWIISQTSASADCSVVQKSTMRAMDAYESAPYNAVTRKPAGDTTQLWIFKPPLVLPTPAPTPVPPGPVPPTPQPTPAPATPAPTPEPTYPCLEYCESHTAPWERKCTFNDCRGCSVCEETCRHWCSGHTRTWATKCSWGGCLSCAACGEDASE